MSDAVAAQPLSKGEVTLSPTEMNSSGSSDLASMQKDQEINDLRAQVDRSQASVFLLREGMRLLAAQIRQADLSAKPIAKIIPSDDQTIATECDTVFSEDDTPSVMNQHRARTWSTQSVDPTDVRLCEITDALTQSQTADMLALQNAAHMLQEHARLSSQEAVLAVQDTVAAQTCMEEWKRRAIRAETKWEHVAAENARLCAKNKKLSTERRVLVKEVRKLHQAQSSKQDYWTQFESYIKGAMNMHEQQLKKKKQPPEVSDDLSTYSAISDEEGATVTLKTDKPIHVESETRATPSLRTPRKETSCATPTSPDGQTYYSRSSGGPDNATLSPPSAKRVSAIRAAVSPRVQQLSSLGGGLAHGMRRQVQRTFAATKTPEHESRARLQQRTTAATVGSSSPPPDRIHVVYPGGECVSPVMSYDSVDGVWSVEDNSCHSKSSPGDGGEELDKECSGCTAVHGN